MAITEMVPDHIWAPDFFGPQEIWALRNLGPEKFGPRQVWALQEKANDFHAGNKFLGAHISRGPNFLGTKKVRGPNVFGDQLSYSRFRH